MQLERYGLIEVDLMPTFKGEITPNLGTWPSLLTDYGWEIDYLWLGLKQKGKKM